MRTFKSVGKFFTVLNEKFILFFVENRCNKNTIFRYILTWSRELVMI